MVSFSGAISVEDDSHPYAHTEAKYIYTGIMPVLFHLNYNGNSSLLHSHVGFIRTVVGYSIVTPKQRTIFAMW